MKDYPRPDPGGVSYPPQPVIHSAACPDAPDLRSAGVDMRPSAAVQAAYPYANAHACIRPLDAPRSVVVDLTPPPPHDYEMSMIWPARAARYLCRVCRGTHTEE